MKVGELFVQLGVLADSKTLKDFVGAIGQLPMEVAGGLAALAGLQYKLLDITANAMNAAVGFKLFTDSTGLSWKELQQWQIVAEQANVSTEAVASSVTALEKNLAEIRLGRGNIAPFQMLGINPAGQTAFSVLNQLRDRIKGLDRPTAVNLISQMGLSPEMIHLLTLSNSEFTKLSHTIHGFTTEQQHDFLRAKDALVKFGMVAREVGFIFVGHLVAALERIVDLIKRIPVHMPTLIASLALLGAAFAPMTAAVVGLLLLLDDLAVYFSGGDSLIGDAIEGFKKLGTQLKEAFDFKGLSGLMGALNLGGLNPLMMGALGAGNAAATSKSVQNIFHMTIHGSGPAEAIGKEVTRQIAKHFGKSEQEFNNQGH